MNPDDPLDPNPPDSIPPPGKFTAENDWKPKNKVRAGGGGGGGGGGGAPPPVPDTGGGGIHLPLAGWKGRTSWSN